MAEALTLKRPLEGLARRAAAVRGRLEALVRVHPRRTIGVGAASFCALAAIAAQFTIPSTGTAATPPAPPSMVMRQMAPADALKVNAAIPLADAANPAADPFAFKGNSAARAQALQCLASAVYYEAGSQSDDGERAVAQVVLNRVRHPAFPNSVCGVVYQGSTQQTGCQFTFTCDGSLNRAPDAAGWRRAMGIATAALDGSVFGPVGWATHYHADYVVPYWAASLAKNAVVGAHLFYHWPGRWGQPGIFSDGNSGHEPNAAALRSAALAVVHAAPQGSTLEGQIAQIPGAEEIKLTPSMRGDKRVAVRFNQVARKAAAEAPHEAYTKSFDASDNLRWSLSTESTASDEAPLGKAAPVSTPGAGH
jgi:spore germination cell wall hydrolase CwlJ-like protein